MILVRRTSEQRMLPLTPISRNALASGSSSLSADHRSKTTLDEQEMLSNATSSRIQRDTSYHRAWRGRPGGHRISNETHHHMNGCTTGCT